jgi:hypothetical protein
MRKQSVTKVTLKKRKKPHKCNAILKPWLDLANGEHPPRFRLGDEFLLWSDVSGPQIAEWVKQTFERMCDERGRDFYANYPDRLGKQLPLGDVLPKEWGPSFHLPPMPDLVPYGELRVVDGVLETNPSDLRMAFLSAIAGAELQRFRTCAVCEKFLYAVRVDKKGVDKKACSTECASVLRVRRWRANQAEYEQTRKSKT